jgi:hypothetical protein
MKTGQVIQLQMKKGLVLCWQIKTIHMGGVGQESVVELRTLGRKVHDLDNRCTLLIPVQFLDVAINSGLVKVYTPE